MNEAGCEILNRIELNQVLVRFADDEMTRRVIEALLRYGTYWCGGNVCHGRAVMRISVSSWETTDDDVAQPLAVMLQVAKRIREGRDTWNMPPTQV